MTTEDKTPRLHQSIAHVLVTRSPLHAWEAHLGRAVREETPAMLRGTILDRLLFGVGPELQVVEAKDWRTNAAKDQRDAAVAAGRLPVLAHQLEEYGEAVAAINLGLAARGIVLDGQSQVEVEWTSEEGVKCAGRLDHLKLTQATILDLKTTFNASPEAIQRHMVDHGADIQRAAYVEAIETLHPQLAGRVRMQFVYAETSPPYAITIAEPAGSMRALGSAKWRRAKRVWAECLTSGHWPAYSDTVVQIESRPWQLEEEMTKAGPVADPDWLREAI